MRKEIKYILIALFFWFIMKTKKVPNQLTKNFHIDEFQSKDGYLMPDDVKQNIWELAKNLQYIRDIVNEPVYVNSGYRSVEHNRNIGGVANSQHIYGKAADITVKSMSPKELAILIEQAINNGKMKQGGIGIYDNFLHYDIRGKKARWQV